MIASNGHDPGGREIAHALAGAVIAAVEAARARASGTHSPAREASMPTLAREGGTPSMAMSASRGVADLLDLHGLAALLAACEAHAGAPPQRVPHVLDRLARLAAETDRVGGIEPFTAADSELAALAGTIQSQDWTSPTPAEPAPVELHSLADELAEFDIDDPTLVAGARVTLPVAAGLRAALEWVAPSGRVRASIQDGALTLGVRVENPATLVPAGALLGLVGGALLPEGGNDRWALRLPLHIARPAFLLARQGVLAIALPWHAVARLRIVDDAARAAMGEASLAPWSPLARVLGERPAALLAHGLTRAWVHLDHIVWRAFAAPEPGHAPAALPGSRTCMRTDDAAEFCVIDVAAALLEVASPPAPQLPPPTRRH